MIKRSIHILAGDEVIVRAELVVVLVVALVFGGTVCFQTFVVDCGGGAIWSRTGTLARLWDGDRLETDLALRRFMNLLGAVGTKSFAVLIILGHDVALWSRTGTLARL